VGRWHGTVQFHRERARIVAAVSAWDTIIKRGRVRAKQNGGAKFEFRPSSPVLRKQIVRIGPNLRNTDADPLSYRDKVPRPCRSKCTGEDA
jgi:hypothetical protein